MKTASESITKFCVLTNPRSGSTWFMALMNTHPKIGTFGEVFLNREKPEWYDQTFLPADRFCQFKRSVRGVRPWSTYRYLDMLVENFSANCSALGFKLMFKQLLRYVEIVPKLVWDRYRIIHLVRENYLDVLISERIVRKRGEAHSRAEVEQHRVHLEPSSLVKILKGKRRKVNGIRLFLQALPVPVLEITYESLCEDNVATLNTAAGFLSVSSYTGYSSEFKKISGAPDWERIENYREIREVLSGTEFQDLLDTGGAP